MQCVSVICLSHFLDPLSCSNTFPISPFSQTEKSYQKQIGVALNKKVTAKAKKSKETPRFYKEIGLGFKTPKEAITGNYIDKKCPFTSNVTIRGRILKGVVRTFKMKRTLVIRRNYMHYLPKYNRFQKCYSTLAAHVSPAFRVKEGDTVTVGECRYVSIVF